MGVFGCCTKFCGVLTLGLSLIIGYFNTFEHPMGGFFQTLYLVQGAVQGKPGTIAVPDDMKPKPRPEKELFLELPGGDKMPANGIGMCCRPTAYVPESVYNTVLWYLLEGGRHIDTAALYGNHVPIGEAIREAIKRGVPRSEIFVVTKVWPDSFGYDSTMEKVRRAVKQELQLDYVDLILMHMPRKISPRMFWNMKYGGDDEFINHGCKNQVDCRKNTWKALSELRTEGLIREAGVSNFQIDQMKELQEMNMAPIAANQLQYHPWLPEWQKEVVDYCHQHKIVVTAYFSLGGEQNKQKAMDMELIKDIAKKHETTASQVLLRWALQKNVTIIPGTGNPKHMRENLNVYNIDLTDEETAKIDGLKSDALANEFMFFKM